MNIPKIRVKGVGGEWNSLPLGDVFDLRNGYTPSKAVKRFWEGGTIPWFRMEDIRANGGILSDSIQHITPSAIKGNGLFSPFSIILATTATIGVHAMLIADSLANQRFTNLKICKSLINSFDPYFVYYAFFKIDEWCVKNTNSGGLLAVDIRSLCKYEFPTPPLSEQRAIATYFRHIDKLIETAEKKLNSLKQVKEASLQSMFPKEGRTVPQVRFKGFEGEWSKIKLNSIAKRVTRKNVNLETQLPVTISSQDGIVAQTSFFNNVVASSNLRGYYLIKRGEFAYNKSYSNGYPYGSVKRLEKYDMGALSTLYIVFSLNEDVCQDYILTFFETDLWHQEVAMRASEGARNHGLLNIGADDFLDIEITLPSNVDEQRKIASFFAHLDKSIDNQKQRLGLLKCVKSTCLSEMFV